MPGTAALDAAAAARALGVTRATLYAYVSRGLIGTEPNPVDPRRSLYRAADIDRLRLNKARGRKKESIAAATLDWGVGALPSRLTLVEAGRLFYRGEDATKLAERATLEKVAGLLWGCAAGENPFARPPPAAAPLFVSHPFPAPSGGAILNREPARLRADGAGLLRTLAASMLGSQPRGRPIHQQFARTWRLSGAAVGIVRAALVLLADHELNASTFAARVVASTGASLAACVTAGLAALSGPLHGGATALAAVLLDDAARQGDVRAVIEARLRSGERIPAFGHPLYAEGDPRATFLLERLPPDPSRNALVAAVADIVGQRPNVDFALAAMVRAFGLPPHGGLALFATARSVGWIAHALEQNAEAKLIRPRAAYVGARPSA